MSPHYTFACERCGIYFQVEGSMDDPPKPEDQLCEDFGEECEVYRSFQDDVPGLKFVGLDFYTIRAREEKFAREGMDKDTAERFYNESIRNSRKRMESGGQHYTPMAINPETAVAQGIAKKVTNKEKLEQRKKASEFWKDHHRKVMKDK